MTDAYMPVRPREVITQCSGDGLLGGTDVEHPDPAREPGSDEETQPAFERTATELGTRIGCLIQAIQAPTTLEVTERG